MPDARIAAILGAGVQARLQLKALTLVRPIREARVWARRFERADAAAAELRETLGIDIRAEWTPGAAIKGADVIVTTTPSNAPILASDGLAPGQHVTAMGSDAEHKNELDPRILARADLYVADSLKQARRLGELHHAIEAGIVADDDRFPELGAIIAGQASGRASRSDITVCDLTGTGVQDTAIAAFAHARAVESGVGTPFET